MNIYTVRDNLKQTIRGKEVYLLEIRNAREVATAAEDMALYATGEMLKLNIDELNHILADVEVCCEKATADSWALNPDRMGQ